MEKDYLKKHASPFLLLLVALFSLLSLIFGAFWLDRPLHFLFDIPLGNILAYFGLVSTALLSLFLLPSSSRWIYVGRFVTVLAACWLPVSIFMAGNVNLNFSGETQPWLNWYQ